MTLKTEAMKLMGRKTIVTMVKTMIVCPPHPVSKNATMR